MDVSIELCAADRKMLAQACQRGPTVRVSRRAQVVLLLSSGWSWREVRAIAFVSYDLIRDCLARWKKSGLQSRIPGWLAGGKP